MYRQFLPIADGGGHLGGDWLYVQSAGIESHGKNPRAIDVMRRAGVDISAQESTTLTDEMLASADILVTVCGHAAESCPALPPGVRHEHWALVDPARATGTEIERMDVFTECCNDIRQRVAELISRLEKQVP